MKIKILILALMFVLLVPLYIALDNLTGHEQREIKTSSIVVTISTTSDWARVSFNGASIKDYKVLDKTEGLKDIIVDKTGIILNKNKDNVTETIRLVLELSIFDKKLELVTTKDYNGELIVDIDKTGRYKNNKKTLQVPITIETTSDWTKTELDGATIRNARIIDLNGSSLREPIVGTKSITLAKLNTNDTSYGRVKFLVDLSLDTPIPIVNIEKTNNGITKVNIGELTLENNQTTESIIRNIPLTIETSSNRTEVKFQGIYLRTVKPLENIPETITGLNFISLNYSHSGNSYRKASYLVDIGITANLTNVTLTKNDPGFAIVNLGTYMFANVAKDKNNNSIKYSFDPSRLPVIAVREPLFGFN